VEDAYDATAHLEAVLPEAFETREPELLRLAKEWMHGYHLTMPTFFLLINWEKT